MRARQRENRLTELLRVVLIANRGLAHLLLRSAELLDGGDVEVTTQVRTRRGKYVDLEVLCLEDDGIGVRSRLWSEHKTGSDYSPGQLDGYAGDLDASFDGKRRLITIVDNAADAGPHDPRWDVLTWREVAVMAWQEGRDVGGMWWRVEAMDPAAPARLRLLHELLTYLEEEHHAVTDPLSHLHIVAFQNANNASDALIGVLERAADRSGLEPDGGHQWDKNDLGWYWQHFKLPGGWQAALEGNAELVVAEADSWAYDRTEEAAFGAGLTVPDSYYTALRESSRQPWRSELEAKDFVVSSNDDGWVRMYRTLYCAELLSKGSTVDAQAKFLGEWATEAIEFLAAHPPAPTLGP